MYYLAKIVNHLKVLEGMPHGAVIDFMLQLAVIMRWICVVFILCVAVGNEGHCVQSRHKEPIQINADSFEYDSLSKMVLASGNVVVVQKDIVMTGQRAFYNQGFKKMFIQGPVKLTKGNFTLHCDKVYAFEQEFTIIASSNVTFSYDKITGSSQKADYSLLSDSITLTGHPTVIRDKDRLWGTRIVIFLKTKKIKTIGNANMILEPESLKEQ